VIDLFLPLIDVRAHNLTCLKDHSFTHRSIHLAPVEAAVPPGAVLHGAGGGEQTAKRDGLAGCVWDSGQRGTSLIAGGLCRNSELTSLHNRSYCNEELLTRV